MKKILFTLILLVACTMNYAQTCEQIVKNCEKLFLDENGNKAFISDGQVYTAFLDRQQAEFYLTFYGGTTYRIVVGAGEKDEYVVFNLIDPQGNLLFTNKDHRNARYWDIKVPETISVRVQTQLDENKKISGCAVMLVGFKQL